MLVMCGLLVGAGDKFFPKWFRDIFGKHVEDIGKSQIITHVIEDTEIPVFLGLTKKIMKRDWTARDLDKLAALVNAEKRYLCSPWSSLLKKTYLKRL